MWFEFIVALLVLFYIYKTGLSNMSIKKFLIMFIIVFIVIALYKMITF